MRKKTGILLGLILLMICCSACQVRNVTKGMDEGEHYDAVISIKPVTDSKSADAVEELSEYGVTSQDLEVLQTMFEMPGMTDAESADVFDGGEENYTADESLLVGRTYTVSLFGEECSFYASYGQEGTVEIAYVILPGDDIGSYSEMFSLIYGEAEEYTDENGEPTEWIWEKDGKAIWLYQDESIILDFSLDMMEE